MSTPKGVAAKGYTTKILLASEIVRLHLEGKHYVWFACELNPIQNGDSSNPLLLYREIDTAVKKRDVNHPKIKDLKANLLIMVVGDIEPTNLGLARHLKSQIMSADISQFRPQLWRLDLARIDRSRWDQSESTSGWDEQRLVDLREGEFDVIVE